MEKQKTLLMDYSFFTELNGFMLDRKYRYIPSFYFRNSLFGLLKIYNNIGTFTSIDNHGTLNKPSLKLHSHTTAEC